MRVKFNRWCILDGKGNQPEKIYMPEDVAEVSDLQGKYLVAEEIAVETEEPVPTAKKPARPAVKKGNKTS